MFTIPFEDEASLETRLVGGKAFGLAQMTKSGLPVAPGFTVSTLAYHQHLEESGLKRRIAELMRTLSHEAVEPLAAAAAQIREWFDAGEFPPAIRADIDAAYAALCARCDGTHRRADHAKNAF